MSLPPLCIELPAFNPAAKLFEPLVLFIISPLNVALPVVARVLLKVTPPPSAIVIASSPSVNSIRGV